MHSNLNAVLMYPKDNVSFQEKQQEWKLILAKPTKFSNCDLKTYENGGLTGIPLGHQKRILNLRLSTYVICIFYLT